MRKTHSSPEAVVIVPGSAAAWRVALRPKTLWIATIPVVVATCLAWSLARAFDAGVAAIALAAAVLMQVVTNLQNDVGYTQRGGETGSRVGLPRATANGWLSVGAVKRAIAAAIVAAWAYMGGPRPIAYTPFGEFTVFVFFGLVAVGGTYYVQAGTIVIEALLTGAAIGAVAAAVLLVNNFRDRAHDATTGRRTLPVVLGVRGSQATYALLLAAPFVLAVAIAWSARSAWFALPLLALPSAARLVATFRTAPPGLALTGLMFRTVKLEIAFGALLSAAALIHRAG